MFKTAAQISKRSFTSSGARNYFARAQILGRVGADVEEVVSASGTRYAKYSIAVQNNRDYPPHWFQVVAFNPKQVDFMVKYVKKGTMIHVDCGLVQETYEREDGSRASSTSLIQQKVDILSNPRSEAAEEDKYTDDDAQ